MVNENEELNPDRVDNENNHVNNDPIPYRLCDRRNIEVPQRYGDPLLLNDNIDIQELFISQTSEPITYNDAINCDDSLEWQKAMREEFDSLIDNQT